MTAPELTVLAATDPAWDAVLVGQPHDVYHTAGYHRVAEAAGEGRPALYVARSGGRGLAWPALVRSIPGASSALGREAIDLSSVYGYPGPVALAAEPGDPAVGEAWRAIVDAWRGAGIVSVFSRFHPLLENDRLVGGLAPDGIVGGVRPGGQTISIDCRAGDGEIRDAWPGNLRREIDAGRRAGLATTEDRDWGDLETFQRLYTETMVRSAASAYYFFSTDDLRRLRDELGGALHLLVTRLGDAIAAAGLFTELDGIVQTHLVATSAEHLKHSPYKVLIDDARTWARERGDRTLHLGGGRGGAEDSLFWFKARFSPRRHAFSTGRWVLDRAAYARLSERPIDPELAGFFPAYRG
jgi:hypothetical protein